MKKTTMKKTFLSAVIMMISYGGIAVSSIWTVVEFIIYLVKDHEFNWWSLWTLIISICALIVSMILVLLFSFLEKRNIPKTESNNTSKILKKSKFQLKLEEMENQKKKSKKQI